MKHVQKQGATIVALAEWDKEVGTYALYNEEVLDYEDLAAFKQSIVHVNYPKRNEYPRRFLGFGCDISIPAALRMNAITEESRNDQGKIICEAAQ